MARTVHDKDISATLAAADQWIKTCILDDGSIFSPEPLWTPPLVQEVRHAFIDHPDTGTNDFMTKLKGQMKPASQSAQRLMTEMLWALLLFPSNMKARTKRQQVRDLWALSGQQLAANHPLLRDEVLNGIGSGGPGLNNYRPAEMTFLIDLTRDLKGRDSADRRTLLTNYDSFIAWIDTVRREGSRQFRHMLRFFAFPDRVERISSNNDRRSILTAFEVAPVRQVHQWTDRQLDEALLNLRNTLQSESPAETLDFYMPKLKERWAKDRKVKTLDGEITVTVPSDQDEEGDSTIPDTKGPDVRQSIQVQAKLAEIGAAMGFRIWLPRNDRARIREIVMEKVRGAFLDDLPLSYDQATLDTIEQIDVLWLKGRSIARAFEVEHTTAIYSGLLRMADLLALQPNMDIRLHIVAPDERRDKVFGEMLRPVFSLLDRGPLARSCTFLSYESVNEIRSLEHLAYTTDSIIKEYEEPAQVSLS
jgi:hypothetical protein